MKLTSEEMRTLYQQQTARSVLGQAECLSVEVMARAAAGELISSEREKAADHLMVCSDCAEEYQLLCELKPWAEQAAVSIPQTSSVIKPVRGWVDNKAEVVPNRPSWPHALINLVSPGIASYGLAALFVITLICIGWVVSSRRENSRIVAQ